MKSTNPKIDGRTTTVQRLIETMPKTNPQTFTIAGTIPLPSWTGLTRHFQGIAPINGVIEITGNISASADPWWCASFVESTNPATVTRVISLGGTYDHAGGIQRLGDLLPIPLEGGDLATVAFYDLTAPPSNWPLYEIHVAYKASAVAITNYTDPELGEMAIILIYRYDPHWFYIYRARADDVGNRDAWVYMGETNELLAEDQFQCFALVTQANANGDQVYLIGFRQDQVLALFTVDTTSSGASYGELAIVTTWPGWSGSEWRYAVGLQICHSTMIRIFGSSKDPSGDSNRYTFPIYYWG